MAEDYTDPSGNTEAFRAFADTAGADGAADPASRSALVIGAAVAAVALVAVVAWLTLG